MAKLYNEDNNGESPKDKKGNHLLHLSVDSSLLPKLKKDTVIKLTESTNTEKKVIPVDPVTQKLCNMSADELWRKGHLEELKTRNFEVFKTKFKELNGTDYQGKK